jgi:hypothetical protein
MESPQLRGRLENFKTIATFAVYPALTLNPAFSVRPGKKVVPNAENRRLGGS